MYKKSHWRFLAKTMAVKKMIWMKMVLKRLEMMSKWIALVWMKSSIREPFEARGRRSSDWRNSKAKLVELQWGSIEDRQWKASCIRLRLFAIVGVGVKRARLLQSKWILFFVMRSKSKKWGTGGSDRLEDESYILAVISQLIDCSTRVDLIVGKDSAHSSRLGLDLHRI